jgi:hypothetical protein
MTSNPVLFHESVSRASVPTTSSSARLDQDLLARLQRLDAENRSGAEWHQPVTGPMVEASVWLGVAFACWLLANTFL